MKKVLTVLLVISLVLALAAAGGAGYFWYINNHVFLEGDAYPLAARSLDLRAKDISRSYFEQLQELLPDCTITWNVPFQGGKVSSDSRELSISTLSEEDKAMLPYFPKLEKINAQGCGDYMSLVLLQNQRPDLEILYQVDLGGTALPPDATQAELNSSDYSFGKLLENLKFLSKLESLTLRMPELTLDQVRELRAAYENLDIRCTVELQGQEYETDTTALDLSGLTSGDVDTVAEKLGMLSSLETVELMSGGSSQLTMEDVKTLQSAAPDAVFHYSFDFFGETISTTDEEVYIKDKKIGTEGLPQVRQALDLMESCGRFVLENCKIPNEEMAKLREEYRDKTKVVWRVYFGDGGSCLTDREVIKAVYGLDDSNSHDLVYCEGARFCDFGHDEFLFNCDFVAGMPNLEAIILSGSPIKSLEPFKNCKKLKFLEVAFCGYIEDVSPLAGCESLEMLNISYTKVSDLSPLDNLPLKLLCAKTAKVPAQEQNRYAELNPDCWAQYEGKQPYGPGWRYTEDGKDYLPYYEMLRSPEIFDYAVIMNTTRW